MKFDVIIAAGGKSQRYGKRNKLFEPYGSSIVLLEAIKPFLQTEGVDKIIVGIESSYADEFLDCLDNFGLGEDRRIKLAIGGNSRTQTVKNALEVADADVILVHDGARPGVSVRLINSVLKSLDGADAALPLVRLTDSLVNVRDGIEPCDRDEFRRVQTPFAAKAEVLKTAYKNAKSDFYDDISVIKTLENVKIAYVDGDESNYKITYPGDVVASLVGCGYDIHRLTKGDHLRIAGVDIPCPFKAVAHSDGDVAIHALMDAILTALGEKDIGFYFPVDDPKYDGIDSMKLLNAVLGMARERGYGVFNASISIIAERPKIAPYVDAMKKRLALALDVPEYRVGIAATTNEGVGVLGREEAAAAFASCLLTRV